MNTTIVSFHLRKIFLGAVIWGIFYYYIFFNVKVWDQTLFGQLFNIPYTKTIIYAIQLIFFIVLTLNLYTSTIGKKNVMFTPLKTINTLIFISIIVLITQIYTLQTQTPFHYGIIGYINNSGLFAHGFLSPLDYALYTAATIFLVIYLAGIFVYLYQIIRMNIHMPFFIIIRVLIIALIYGLTLGLTPQGFDYMSLLLYSIYVFIIFIVYLSTKHSLKGLMFAAILLFLI
jgi:hypothetical protein